MNLFIWSSRESSKDKASTFYTNFSCSTYLHQYLLLQLHFTQTLYALLVVKFLHTLKLRRPRYWVIKMSLRVLEQGVFDL